jgi:phosphotransferase system IIA component
MYVVMMSFLKRWKGLYVCDLEDETQKRLSISGAEVRKKDMLIKVDLENLSEVQVSSIQGLPCH